jgi:nucleotide-binding universal stress UspA family protein
MFSRILFIISEKPEDKHFVIELAKRHESAVLIGALITADNQENEKAEGATHRRVLLEDRERKSWQRLYRLEEEFKAAGITSSVLAQRGTPTDIETLAHNTRADLIVIGASSLADSNYRLPDEFIPHLPCPIIVLPTA